MARKKMMYPMEPSCYEGCTCKSCQNKDLGNTGVDSGLSSRESMGKADVGTVKSWDLVEGEEFRPDKTNNDQGRVF
jgi:hypothetical protein